MNETQSYKNKLKWNSISAILLQVVTAVSGIILPRIIITNYGSGVNGLIASITQFLSYIALLETGIGGVIQTACAGRYEQSIGYYMLLPEIF